MAYTGGELNELNGKAGVSAAHNSVPVMKLIRYHKPKTKNELAELIAIHHFNECYCGVKSQGRVEDFGRNLYEAQKMHWKEYRYSLKDCIQWEYDLFVTQSLKGNNLEQKAIDLLRKALPEYSFIEATGFLDEELRVDVLVKNADVEVMGIQIKPETFKKMRSSVQDFNHQANAKWGKEVFYLFYNEKEEFINLEGLLGRMKRD